MEVEIELSLVLEREVGLEKPNVRLIRFMDALKLHYCKVAAGYAKPFRDTEEDEKWPDPEM